MDLCKCERLKPAMGQMPRQRSLYETSMAAGSLDEGHDTYHPPRVLQRARCQVVKLKQLGHFSGSQVNYEVQVAKHSLLAGRLHAILS